jgi:hypothetical protein
LMGKLVYFSLNPLQSSRDPLVTKSTLTEKVRLNARPKVFFLIRYSYNYTCSNRSSLMGSPKPGTSLARHLPGTLLDELGSAWHDNRAMLGPESWHAVLSSSMTYLRSRPVYRPDAQDKLSPSPPPLRPLSPTFVHFPRPPLALSVSRPLCLTRTLWISFVDGGSVPCARRRPSLSSCSVSRHSPILCGSIRL